MMDTETTDMPNSAWEIEPDVAPMDGEPSDESVIESALDILDEASMDDLRCGGGNNDPNIQMRLDELHQLIEKHVKENPPGPPRNATVLNKVEPDPQPIKVNLYDESFGRAHLSLCIEDLQHKAELIRVTSIRRNVLAGLKQAQNHLNDKNGNPKRVAQYCAYVDEQISDALSFINYTRQVISVRNSRNLRKTLNRPDTRSWFHLPMGIEYTFHFPEGTDLKNECFSRGKCHEIKDEVAKLIVAKNQRDNIKSKSRTYIDQTVLEVCSPIHKNWQDMSNWYEWLYKHIKRLDMFPFSEKRGGGGGHINVSTPYVSKSARKKKRVDYMFMRNLLVDIANRPYLNWVFNDPSDNHTANCLWTHSDMIGMYFEFEGANEERREELIGYVNSRGYAIRVKDDFHFEMRFFDMVRCKRDLLHHVQFVSSYMKWIKERTDKGEVIAPDHRFVPMIEERRPNKPKKGPRRSIFESVMNDGSYKEVFDGFDDFDKVSGEFYEMIDTIGLRRKDFRRFVERNMRLRMNEPYGKEYLK